MDKTPVIFFGNGPLADFALPVLQQSCEILFHARTREDLTEVVKAKTEHPEALGILASFGVMIKSDLLELFEPTGGIINIHPSLLPKYRGASPIESAILAGDKDFSYSIMKLAKAMDAGPIYHQATIDCLPINKTAIYQALAEAGATWITEHLSELQQNQLTPTPQNDQEATFTEKLTKSMSLLQPSEFTAEQVFRQIVAYQDFPKPKYVFMDKTCIIRQAHVLRVTDILCEAAGVNPDSPLMLQCKDRNFVVIDELQPEGKNVMTAKAFMNGYGKKH